MPKVKKVYMRFLKRYGKKRGKDIYYGWEQNQKKKGKW